jgi:outer membrane protein assembly factor BamB
VRWSNLLLALIGLLGGCQGNPQQPANRNVWHDARWPYALVQANLYEVVAFDTIDGAERWRYRRAQPPPAPFGEFPVSTVLCRPEWTASHTIVLSFSDGIHVITAESGELLWTKDLALGGNCPTVTPDSGIVVILENGTRLQKLAGDGRALWHHDFWEAGVAIAKPVVVEPSGDTLVRTAKFLLNISPDGHRNWVAETTDSPTRLGE